MSKYQAAAVRRGPITTRAVDLGPALERYVLPGYRFVEPVHHSARAIVVRAVRDSDGQSVILKFLSERAFTPENVAHFRHEYEILRSLRAAGAIQVFALEQMANTVALVTEDFGGTSLKDLLQKQGSVLTLGDKLGFAVKLAQALRDVHSARIVHKDINPNNVVVNLQTGEVKLIDFGLATPLPVEWASTTIPTQLQGTLQYIAPEQTGRMNRAVDYRSDFYSLGATLYELFTGQPPFTGRDALELIHAHIARQPTAPNGVDASIPEPLSAIILKLLAKTAEERYQSILSLEADLTECVKQWRADGKVEPFPIDRLQVRDQFRLPQKLYGREQDIQTLLAAFDRASRGKPEALFITGISGIGKTSLVREVHKPITAKRGYFAAGKFDQFQRNTPYSAILSALQELTRQILSESEEQVTQWRQRLLEAFGPNARVMMEILPDLELIIGEQPPVPALGPIETQERLANVMRKFFAAVCQQEHPLALYLDDLQWADSASVGMLLQILCDDELHYFLLIGSYRDNEVEATHPLLLARAKLQAEGVTTGEVRLVPHTTSHIERLIVDTLGILPQEAAPLAALVHEKTGGNPFFVEEFLKSLYAKDLLRFDNNQQSWRWELERIRTEAVTDNVVELLAQNIRALPDAAQRLLRLAACIGSHFDTHTLAVAAEESTRDVSAGLREAIVHGFVHPLDEAFRWASVGDDAEPHDASFRFAHDRVQQAVYESIPADQRAHVHYRLGRLLLSTTNPATLDRDRFHIVNHLNAGRTLALAAERVELAELNLAAGRKAKTSAVHEAALVYFRTGIELLGENAWEAHYELALALNSEAGQTAPLVGGFAELDAKLHIIREKARTALEMMPIYEAKIEAEHRRADFRVAGATGLEALVLLGAGFPKKPTLLHLLYYKARAHLALFGRTPESLRNHPRMTDPMRIAEARILRLLGHVFYNSNRGYLVLTVYRQLYLCAKHGHSDTAPFVYASYGVSLCAGKEIEKGYRFGKLALALLDTLDAKAQRPMVLSLVHSTLSHWNVHCRDALPTSLDIYRQAIDNGDLESAGSVLVNHGYLSFHVGEALPSLRDTLQNHAQSLRKIGDNKRDGRIVELYRDAVSYLMNAEGQNECFPASGEVDKKVEKKHPYTFHFFKTFMAIHFADMAHVSQHAQMMRRYAYTVIGILRFGDLYDGLAQTMAHSTLNPAAKTKSRKAVIRIVERLRLFALHAPENYMHRYLLLGAELARIEGSDALAEQRYDEAMAAARDSGHVHEEALAAELAGRHFMARNKALVAESYLRRARALYARWGATRKVQWLEDTYPQLDLAGSAPRAESLVGTISEGTAAPLNLDLPVLMKALKAIAEETVHSHILKRTIDIVMQFAGAEKALLLLRNAKDELLIEADMDTAREEAELLKSIPIEASKRLSQAVVNYAKRTKASVVIHDAQELQSVIPGLQNDPYIRDNRVRSILCIPVNVGTGRDAELIGVLYVENNQSTHAFTERRVETLEIVCLSVAGRLELSRKAITDSLTGLYNRAYFDSALHKELSLARRKKRPLSLVMVDLDHFKRVNDDYGHQVGDAVLQHVARMIKDNSRESDVVARFGGEEMVLILVETNTAQAVEVAERIRQTIEEQPLNINDRLVRATASFGVATNAPGRDESGSLIKAADDALYRSKESGRNRVTVTG